MTTAKCRMLTDAKRRSPARRRRVATAAIAWWALAACALAGTTARAAPAAAPANAIANTDANPNANADALAKADAAIDKGLAYLRAQQRDDGFWGAPTDPPAMSALVLRCFAKQGQAKEPFVAKGYEKLLTFQLADGGIYRDLLANYNTAISLSALAAADDPAYRPAMDRAVAYLKNLQWTPQTRPEYAGKPTDKFPEQNQGKQVVAGEGDPFFGGWGYGGRTKAPGRPDLSNAQMSIEALIDAGVPCEDPAIQRAIAFLTRCQNTPMNDQPWAGTDGGFVYGPAGDRNGETNAGEYADADGKRLLRSYGSMTYAGLKSMIYAGLTRDDPRVKAATDWVRANWTLDENPGMRFAGPEAARAGLFYYYHTLARALAANREPQLALPDGRRVDWRVELIEKASAIQAADGSWTGEKRWMESNPLLATSYVVQALQEARDDLRNAAR